MEEGGREVGRKGEEEKRSSALLPPPPKLFGREGRETHLASHPPLFFRRRHLHPLEGDAGNRGGREREREVKEEGIAS